MRLDLSETTLSQALGPAARPKPAVLSHHASPRPPQTPPDPDFLRACAWRIGERNAAAAYVPASPHLATALVTPRQGYAQWHIPPGWIEQTARAKGGQWTQNRMILRLYDVTCILFNGFNAHRIQDLPLPRSAGHLFFNLPSAGTTQLAEVGFLLQSGEFVPAARAQTLEFPRDGLSPHTSTKGLFVTAKLRNKPVENIWEQEAFLAEYRRPKLRPSLRIAAFAFESLVSGQDSPVARFVSELAAAQQKQGHTLELFVPASERLKTERVIDGVRYHPLEFAASASPLQSARNFAQAAARTLANLPPFDLVHRHEWMSALVPNASTRPAVLSVTSIESVRLGGQKPAGLSLEIQALERQVLHAAPCLLLPAALREAALAEYGLNPQRVHAFPMEGRGLNEWERPLDYGQVKKRIGLGTFDRVMLFVGPLEHAAGVDLLIEALPTVLRRAGNARLVLVGTGSLRPALESRAGALGIHSTVRLLGDVPGSFLTELMRAAEVLVLPSRGRVPNDAQVLDLARWAGRPVVTTNGGPAAQVRHEQDGLVTYDNPGSMVWALDRILGDPTHSVQMGQNGRRGKDRTCDWDEVARQYARLCAAQFPPLRRGENSCDR